MITDKEAPDSETITRLPGFDTVTTEALGHVTEVGVDKGGHRVFVASLGPRRTITRAALELLLREVIPNHENYILVDSLRCIHWKTRVGGFVSRRLGWIRIGRPLAIEGIQKSFNCFKVVVTEVKSLLRASP